jgi:hypothetical protein
LPVDDDFVPYTISLDPGHLGGLSLAELVAVATYHEVLPADWNERTRNGEEADFLIELLQDHADVRVFLIMPSARHSN